MVGLHNKTFLACRQLKIYEKTGISGDQLLQRYRIDDLEECKALCLARLECKMFFFQSGVHINKTPCSLYKTFRNRVIYFKLFIINFFTFFYTFYINHFS